jgi:hypothetical protein
MYALSAKYEFASSNTTPTTFAFDACFVWKLAPLADERGGFLYRKSITTIDAIEHVLSVANSYLAYRSLKLPNGFRCFLIFFNFCFEDHSIRLVSGTEKNNKILFLP